MDVDVASLRSWMFVPTSPGRFLEKVSTRPVDAIIPDLEDGIVASERPAGRQNLKRWLSERTQALPVPYVRINAVSTRDWRLDVEAAMGAPGVVLPKAESPEDILRLVDALEEAESKAGIPAGTTAIVPAIESAAGLLAAPPIAAADPRVCALLFGAEDYALDLGLALVRTGTAADLFEARSAIVVAARAAGRSAIDGVHTALEDEEGLVRQSQVAAQLGFSGKSLFHPAQITVINREFTPSDGELDFAAAVETAFAEAHAGGQGAVAVRGHLVDLPIAERARRLVARSRELKRRDAERASS